MRIVFTGAGSFRGSRILLDLPYSHYLGNILSPQCRIICPYGLLLSLAAGISLFSLQRTDACIDCKCCERNCPVDEAKLNDRKAECYLCGRCTDVCPTAGALQYNRRTGKEKS